MDELLSERYANDLDGVLSCYDRIVITGSLQPFCYAQGMTHYLYQQGIRIFDGSLGIAVIKPFVHGFHGQKG